ncbi:selenoprotein H-like [Iris pallida]|uniref:Selenoprotein H-like n=1 Tax=Iris pallida TaxID=29817 RepID=A0AAX6FIK6_IRIPA|nr:selenoprotein H-like [Iris pallida]KAJ6837815.1 selenoprotein H-like [Iris pallida]
MAPSKKSAKPPASAPAVTASPRKTRSSTAGKRVVPPPAKTLAAKKPPSKKARLTKEMGSGKESSLADSSSAKSVVIEACKQCNSFKTRANMVKEGLESAVAGIAVTINPDKPRRGCFEIRDGSGEVFISLLDMKRPYKPMKDLDMDKVIEDIIKKIN